ncbi:MAG: CPBP family intramembrane glutamic endopeptidase [Planctomycetaceae bacterium]
MIIRSIMTIIVTVVLFAGLPAFITSISHSRFKPTFCLYQSHWTWYLVAFIYSISLWPLLYELNLFINSEASITEMKSYFETFKEGFNNIPLVWKLFAYALIPAVCEEFFFRGFLFSACRTTYPKWTTILLTAFCLALSCAGLEYDPGPILPQLSAGRANRPVTLVFRVALPRNVLPCAS